jgi:outer membrane protein assembly factor BamB
MSGAVVAIDAKRGKQLWQAETGGPVRSTPVLDTEGRLYVGSRDHHLYAIRAADGEVVWRVDLGAEVDSTPALTSGRRVVVGTDDGSVVVLGEAP